MGADTVMPGTDHPDERAIMGCDLPDPELEHGTDPVAAYISGLEDRLRSLRALWEARHTQTRYQAVLGASRALREARLAHYGVDCPACRGRGYHDHPSDPTRDMMCQTCKGRALVMPEVAKRYRDRATERDYSDDEIRGVDR